MAHSKLSARKSLKQEKSADKPTKAEIGDLAVTVAAVLKNPACPETLYTGITDALSEIETHADTLSVDFLFGLFLTPPRHAEEKGGVQ